MHNEPGEPCSKVVAAEALVYDKGSLGAAQECGGVERGEKPSSAETPTTTPRRKPRATRGAVFEEEAGNDEAATGRGSSRRRKGRYGVYRWEHRRAVDAVDSTETNRGRGMPTSARC